MTFQPKKSLERIERAIIKRYRKYLWQPFMKSVREYDMISSGDKIAVAISGGKDSLILAKLLQELASHHHQNFSLKFIAMNPGYTKENAERLLEHCEYLEIPVILYDTDIFEVADKMAGENPCYLCARMRRGALYGKAQELGCNKLALGHHKDDVIETILLNVLCSANYRTMMPKLKSDNYENMEIIRPMYYVDEKSIISWRDYAGLKPLDCACVVTIREDESKRYQIKKLIRELEKRDFTNVRHSIFRSAENVDIDHIIEYKKNGKKTNFLEGY